MNQINDFEPPSRLSINQEIYLQIIKVNNPTDFVAFFGKANEFSEFGWFLKKLNEECQRIVSSAQSLTELKVEQLVMVRSPTYGRPDSCDNVEWRRGRIKSIDWESETLSVFLLDEGHLWTRISSEQILAAENLPDPKEFMSVEARARMCRLKDARPINGRVWTSQAIEFFKKLLDEKEVVVTKFDKIQTRCPSSDFESEYELEISVNGIDLLKEMISKGYANMIGMQASPNRATSETSNIQIFSPKKSSMMMYRAPKNIVESCEDESSTGYEEPELDIIDYIPGSMRYINKSNQPSPNRSKVSRSPEIIEFNEDARDDDDDERNFTVVYKKPMEISEAKKPRNNFDHKQPRHKSNRHCDSDDDDDPAIFINRIDPNDKMPHLKPQTFIASDETILTGYRPNIVIDAQQLAEDIRITKMERINRSRGIQIDSNPSNQKEKSEIIEQNIYDILTGTTGLYDSPSAKIKALSGLHRKNRSNQTESLIIRCILKEFKNDNLHFDVGFEILTNLEFSNELMFIKCLKDIVDGQQEANKFPERSHLADESRKDVCRLLANLYMFSLEIDSPRCLRRVPKYCVDLVEDWVGINMNRQISDHALISNFKNVHDFLEASYTKFKRHSLDTAQYVHKKVCEYALDITYRQELRTECIRILILFSKKSLFGGAEEDFKLEKNSARGENSSPYSSDSTIPGERPHASNNPRHFNYYSRTYGTEANEVAFSRFLQQARKKETYKRKSNEFS